MLLAGCGTVSRGARSAAQTTNKITTNTTAQPVSKSPLVGKMAPNFSLQTLDQKSSRSLHQLVGKKVVLINAFASWCPPCQQETSDLIAMSKKYAGKVQFIGVDMTYVDSVSDAKNFVHKYGITYPVLLDTKGAFSQKYQILGYPTTFILNASGTIVNVHSGILTKTQIQQLITQALAGATAD